MIGGILGWLNGTIAASFRYPIIGPVIGAISGAVMGYGSSIVTLYFLCMATYGPKGGDHVNLNLYMITMAVVGAIPGIVGGVVADRVRRNRPMQIPPDHHTE